MTEAPDAADATVPLRQPLYRDTVGWYVSVSAFWFATSFKWFILFFLLPTMVSDIVPGGQKNSAWGRVVALGAIEAMVGPAIFGYWSDRTRSRWGRRRPFIAIGAALTALALFFLREANTLPLLIVGYLFLQISDDVGTGPYAAIVPDQVPPEKRGRASGILGMLQLFAQIVAAITALVLKKPETIFVVIAAINIICAVIVLLTVRERRSDLPEESRAAVAVAGSCLASRLRGGAQQWLAPWRSADFRWVWLTRFLVAFGFYFITNYVVNYLTDSVRVFNFFGVKFGKPFEAAIVAALCISLAGGIGALIGGRLADKMGRKKVIVVSGWAMFATLVPFALIPVYQYIVLLALVFGMGYGAYTAASWALASDILPNRDDAAKDMGIWQASVSSPQILTGLAGFLVDYGNSGRPGFGYTLGFLLASASFLAGSLLVTRVKGST